MNIVYMCRLILQTLEVMMLDYKGLLYDASLCVLKCVCVCVCVCECVCVCVCVLCAII